MTSIPVPFVVALLLAVLAATHQQRLRETPTGRLFQATLWLYIASVILVGLRWTLENVIFLPFAAVMSIGGISVLYLAFRSLGRSGPVLVPERDWMHALPLIATIAISIIYTPAIEMPLITTKVIYGALLIKLARRAPETLQLVRLGWFKDTQKALWISALFILFSVIIDIIILIDFAYFGGQHAARLVGVVNLFMLLPLGLACVVAGGESVTGSNSLPSPSDNDLPATNPLRTTTRGDLSESASGSRGDVISPQSDLVENRNAHPEPATDNALLDRLNQLLIDDRLYADTELNLQRLARKAGVPARSVSRVINAQTGINMSQWVNNTRIKAACELLQNSEISVSQAMYEVGFTTKSNFNREFKRVTGHSPSLWRQNQR